MNIYDIANKANVSIATVSRVLNGKGNVSNKTKEKVLAVMEELGYTPNIFARSLGLNTMKMVGVMCSSVDDIYASKAVSIIENELRQHGYDVILYCTGNDLEDKKKYLSLLLSKKVDAIIFIGSTFKEHMDNSHLEKAAESIPLFFINSLIDFPNTYCFVCDDEAALITSVDALVAKGHKEMIYLYESETSSGLAKLQGFKKGHHKHQLPLNTNHLIKCEGTLEDSYQMVSKLLKEGPSFTAILTSDDLIAVGALNAIRDHGLHIPEDIAIIGFNNSLFSQCTYPKLTTVDSKVELLCSFAVTSLVKLLDGHKVSNKLVVSPDLVIRQTL